MLSLRGVTKIYAVGDVETTALDNLDLDVSKGEYVAIMGPSGCGKTTLLSVLGLLDVPTRGEYWFERDNVAGWNEDRLSRLRRGQIGFVFQSFNLLEDLSIVENVALALAYSDVSKRERLDRSRDALAYLGIGHRAEHRPSQLSGGQQQRAAIARALVSEPSLLLADEPTGNLDSAHGNAVMDILEDINRRGTTLILVTHSADQATRARRQVHLLDGRLVGDITTCPSEQTS